MGYEIFDGICGLERCLVCDVIYRFVRFICLVLYRNGNCYGNCVNWIRWIKNYLNVIGGFFCFRVL